VELTQSHKDAIKQVIEAISEVPGIRFVYLEYVIYADTYKLWMEKPVLGGCLKAPLIIKESELDSVDIDTIIMDSVELVKTI
jgi:hypothetical protein